MQPTCQRDAKQNENARLPQPEYDRLLLRGSSRSFLEEVGWLRCNKTTESKSDNRIFPPLKQRKFDPLNNYSQLQSPTISPQLLTPHRRCRESVRMYHRSLYSQRNKMSNRSQSRLPLHLPFCDHPFQRSASCPSHLMSHKNHSGFRREYPQRGSNLPASHQSNTSPFDASKSKEIGIDGLDQRRHSSYAPCRRDSLGNKKVNSNKSLCHVSLDLYLEDKCRPNIDWCNADVARVDSKSFRGKGRGFHRHQSNADFGRKPSARLHVQGTPKSHAVKAVSPIGMEVSCGQSEEKQPITFLQLTTEGDVEKIKTTCPGGKLNLTHYTYPGWYEDYEKAETAHKNGDSIQLERYVQRLKKRQWVHDGDRSHPHLVQLDALKLNYPDSVADVQNLEELHFTLLESEESQFYEKLEYLKNKEQASLNMIHCDMKQIDEARGKLMEIQQVHLDTLQVNQARDALMNMVKKFPKPESSLTKYQLMTTIECLSSSS